MGGNLTVALDYGPSTTVMRNCPTGNFWKCSDRLIFIDPAFTLSMSVFLGVLLSLVVGLSVGRPNSYSSLICIKHWNAHKVNVPSLVSTLDLLDTLGHEAALSPAHWTNLTSSTDSLLTR